MYLLQDTCLLTLVHTLNGIIHYGSLFAAFVHCRMLAPPQYVKHTARHHPRVKWILPVGCHLVI